MGNIYISSPRPAQKPIKDQAQHQLQLQLQLGAAITSLLGINYFGTSKISLRLIQTKAPAPKLHRLHSRLFQPAFESDSDSESDSARTPTQACRQSQSAPHANRVGTSTSRGNCKSQHCDSIAAAAPKGFGTQSPPLSSSSSSSCLFRIELNLDMISCPVCFAVFWSAAFQVSSIIAIELMFYLRILLHGPWRYQDTPGGNHLKGYTKPSFPLIEEYIEVCFQVLAFSMSYSHFYAHSQSRNCALFIVIFS